MFIENWDTFPSPEDWDNEEYTGSLADTKVFTPSGGAETVTKNEVDTPKPNENAYLEVEDWNDAVQAPNQQTIVNNVSCLKNIFTKMNSLSSLSLFFIRIRLLKNWQQLLIIKLLPLNNPNTCHH